MAAASITMAAAIATMLAAIVTVVESDSQDHIHSAKFGLLESNSQKRTPSSQIRIVTFGLLESGS